MPDAPKFFYGGQAVIEGVMIRGKSHVSVAVRRPNGQMRTRCEPLPGVFLGAARRIPFTRGVLVLAESLTLGLKALMFSADAALEDDDAAAEVKPLSSFATGGMLAVSMLIAIALFFVGPLLIARAIDRFIASDALSNLSEGGIRLAIFFSYVWLMGRMPDMRRVFAYHGAEHMTIAAHEHGATLTPAEIRKYPKEHPRCGTAFLMVVMVVAILTFVFLGRPDLWLRVLERILFIPVIAAVSYEIIRVNAAHITHPVARLVTLPGLAMQWITTRTPDDAQIEVAIKAMETALAADTDPPATDAPTAPALAAAAPKADEPVAEAPAVKKPAAKVKATTKRAAAAPKAEAPVAEAPAAKKPAAKRTAAAKPATRTTKAKKTGGAERTTDDAQIQVAIKAMETALAADINPPATGAPPAPAPAAAETAPPSPDPS